MNKNLVDIPTFHGDIEQWEVFYQVFRIMAEEDDNIPKVMKHNILRNHVSGKPKNGQTPNRAWLLVVRIFNNVLNIQTQQMLQEMARKRRRRAKEERNSRQQLMVHHLRICPHPKFRSEHQKERRDQRYTIWSQESDKENIQSKKIPKS